MGTFSIWGLITASVLFGLPVIAVATERSGERQSRRDFLKWTGLLFISHGIVYGASKFTEGFSPPTAIILLISFQVIYFGFFRSIARRCRDAGIGKGLAYAAAIPLINIAVVGLLLFKPSRQQPNSDAVDDEEQQTAFYSAASHCQCPEQPVSSDQDKINGSDKID